MPKPLNERRATILNGIMLSVDELRKDPKVKDITEKRIFQLTKQYCFRTLGKGKNAPTLEEVSDILSMSLRVALEVGLKVV